MNKDVGSKRSEPIMTSEGTGEDAWPLHLQQLHEKTGGTHAIKCENIVILYK